MTPDTTPPLRLRDPVAEAQRELESLRAQASPLVRAAVRNGKGEDNQKRRAEAIRRIAFELLVVETIDLAQTVVLDVDALAPTAPGRDQSPAEVSDRLRKAREKRERKRARR